MAQPPLLTRRGINRGPSLSPLPKNFREFIRRNNLELFVGAIRGLLVCSPSSKVRGMTKPASLHMIVFDFGDQFRTDCLPRQILTLAPPAEPTGDSLLVPAPLFPWVIRQRVLPIRPATFRQLEPLLFREARANAPVVQRAGLIDKPKQQ